LRQAIVCQGDMALYQYKWPDDTVQPSVSVQSPRICVNWEWLQGWAIEHNFSLYNDLLRHPKFGVIDPLHLDNREEEDS
jgi:hypothetical protein